jgi:hypothetical protein
MFGVYLLIDRPTLGFLYLATDIVQQSPSDHCAVIETGQGDIGQTRVRTVSGYAPFNTPIANSHLLYTASKNFGERYSHLGEGFAYGVGKCAVYSPTRTAH